MEKIYHIIDAFFAPGILIGLAVCLFFLYIPPKAALRNYRIARYVMGGAYLFYAACIYIEYHVIGTNAGSALMKPIILFIACFQALLFTYTMITLIRVNYLTLRQALIEFALIVLLSVALIFIYLHFGGLVAYWSTWIFIIFYIALLMRYVFLFNKEYNRYEKQMDNFYSDEDTRRLYWVKRSFYISLAVGVLALLYAIVPTTLMGIFFMTIVIVFYAAFGVRFINYVLQFRSIEAAIVPEDVEVIDVEVSDDDRLLMQRIDALMAQEKLYRKSDLSVADLADILGERSRQISMVIGKCHQINFKSYINEYRVVEAKRLLDEDKGNRRTVDAIASEAGFANRSSFYRVFKRMEGISPSDYRLGVTGTGVANSDNK